MKFLSVVILVLVVVAELSDSPWTALALLVSSMVLGIRGGLL